MASSPETLSDLADIHLVTGAEAYLVCVLPMLPYEYRDINSLDPHFVVSLHCNAYNGQASGTEVLYYHKSKIGEGIAKILQNHLLKFLGLRDRGIQPKTSEDRGGHLLRYTRAPCVIAEPFFIDNDQDLAKATENLEGLAAAYARAIDEMAQVV